MNTYTKLKDGSFGLRIYPKGVNKKQNNKKRKK